MGSKIRNFFVGIYQAMRGNYFTFRIIIMLKECGINRAVKEILRVDCPDGQKSDDHGTISFIKKNRERINSMLSLLEDDKSRRVWKAAMMCRAKNHAMPKNLWSDTDQYFVKEIIKIGSDEVFVDGGAFIGDTIQHLFNTARKAPEGGSIKRVVAFEPEKNNLIRLKKYFGHNAKVRIVEKGLSDHEGIVYFRLDGSGSQVIDKCYGDDVINIPVTNIDAVDECKDATFIKMDIEGSEMNALYGAKNTILKNKPKLAICIYHSNDDMVRIAEYIHELVPEYKLYVRHHTGGIGETVLYAII